MAVHASGDAIANGHFGTARHLSPPRACKSAAAPLGEGVVVPAGEHRQGENGAIMEFGWPALAVESRVCLVDAWGIPATLCRCRFTSAAR